MLLRKTTILFFLGLTIFSFAQCKTFENKALVKQDKQSPHPITKMGNDTIVSKLNGDKSMELQIKKIIKPGDPAFHFEYIVYNTGTKNIVKEGYFRGTNVEWNDNTSLKLIPYVGMEQKPASDNPEDALLSNTQTKITIIKLNN
ncbi:hypothetical protein [Aquimarina algiphila]|uniref:DUF1425 domain-containing protein n=1 Tax=Aquimarina algiphila TaxID=2047982 RepID=A0A554VM74_9FLAO|nr:hypothetical protein [Aquimarina algiphila]TSE09274.1 hypothetical protein FOF46_09425 [Aquimarina algiphila]